MSRNSIDRALSTLFASLLVMVMAWSGLTGPALAVPVPVPMVGALFSFSGTRPSNVGTAESPLAPCPSTPNCVSSQAQDSEHTIAPLSYDSSPETAFSHLKATIQALPRTQIIQATDNYLYVEFTSAIMGFVDDVEFVLDPGAQVIQVRSASRLGESDLGVNRQRIEQIRSAFAAA